MKALNSNTTLVKVKSKAFVDIIHSLMFIQIQHLLKLNMVEFILVLFLFNSNTTLVKVK